MKEKLARYGLYQRVEPIISTLIGNYPTRSVCHCCRRALPHQTMLGRYPGTILNKNRWSESHQKALEDNWRRRLPESPGKLFAENWRPSQREKYLYQKKAWRSPLLQEVWTGAGQSYSPASEVLLKYLAEHMPRLPLKSIATKYRGANKAALFKPAQPGYLRLSQPNTASKKM